MTITFSPTGIHSRDALVSEIGDATVEFSPDETRISLGKNVVALSRVVWEIAVAKSSVYDAVLGGAAMPISSRPVVPATFDELAFGDPIAGGFFTGFHPVHRNAVLITAPKSLEGRDLSWQAADKHCSKLDGGWKRPDRLEALMQFQRLAVCNAQVDAFKEDGTEAFEDTAYWTDEEYQFGSDFAWGQAFGDGSSYNWGKYGELRVRPVRILFI